MAYAMKLHTSGMISLSNLSNEVSVDRGMDTSLVSCEVLDSAIYRWLARIRVILARISNRILWLLLWQRYFLVSVMLIVGFICWLQISRQQQVLRTGASVRSAEIPDVLRRSVAIAGSREGETDKKVSTLASWLETAKNGNDSDARGLEHKAGNVVDLLGRLERRLQRLDEAGLDAEERQRNDTEDHVFGQWLKRLERRLETQLEQRLEHQLEERLRQLVDGVGQQSHLLENKTLISRIIDQLAAAAAQSAVYYTHGRPQLAGHPARAAGPQNFTGHAAYTPKVYNDTAEYLSKKVRLLCFVPIKAENLTNQGRAIVDTWGRRCSKLIFFSSTNFTVSSVAETVRLNISKERDIYDLTEKVFASILHVYQHEVNNYDWFLKADGDTYIIVENLRKMLTGFNTSKLWYLGQHFDFEVKNGYMSGGAGYVFSRAALTRFATRGLLDQQCTDFITSIEDVDVGRCCSKLGIPTGDTRDSQGRSRFHFMMPKYFIHGKKYFHRWFRDGAKYKPQAGSEHISEYPVSFHWVYGEDMYNLEHYIYHMRPYGLRYE